MSFTLKDVAGFAEPFVSNLPLLYADQIEPAASIGHTLLCTMLGAPFTWEWNREVTAYTVAEGGSPPGSPPGFFLTDDTVAIDDFGFLESAYLVVPSDADIEPGKVYQLDVKRHLEVSSDTSRPTQISVFKDDLKGNITLRLHMCPDAYYYIGLTYQKAAPMFTATKTEFPMPDKMRGVVNYGFLSLALLYNNDARYQEIAQRFVSHLLGWQSGLDETTKSMFAAAYLGQLQSQLSADGRVRQGVQARGIG
jgi:hypothetical protein